MSKRRSIDQTSHPETAAPQGRSASAVKLLTHIPSPDGAGLETAAPWQEAGPTQAMSVTRRDRDQRAGGDNRVAADLVVADGRESRAASGGIAPIIKLGISAYRGTRGTVAAIRQAIADARTGIDRDGAAEPAAGQAAPTPPGPPPPIAQPADASAAPAAEEAIDGRFEDAASHARTRPRPGRGDLPGRGPERPAGGAAPADGAVPPEQPAAPPPPRRIAAWEVVALLILPVTVAALGAFATASLSEPVHAARSEIVFDLRRLDWSNAERYLETQKVVITGRTLLAPIAQTFDLPVLDLERDLRVDKVGDSGVLRLQYRHPDPTLAGAVTKAITDRYLVVLREFERLEGTGHRLLTPAFVLEQPVAPQPLRAAAIGAVIGLALAAAGVVVRSHAWPTR